VNLNQPLISASPDPPLDAQWSQEVLDQ